MCSEQLVPELTRYLVLDLKEDVDPWDGLFLFESEPEDGGSRSEDISRVNGELSHTCIFALLTSAWRFAEEDVDLLLPLFLFVFGILRWNRFSAVFLDVDFQWLWYLRCGEGDRWNKREKMMKDYFQRMIRIYKNIYILSVHTSPSIVALTYFFVNFHLYWILLAQW